MGYLSQDTRGQDADGTRQSLRSRRDFSSASVEEMIDVFRSIDDYISFTTRPFVLMRLPLIPAWKRQRQ